MAHYNLQGRWLQGNWELNIVMTTATEFNIKAISTELKHYWEGGYGEVFESGKFVLTLTGHNPDANFQGYVSADQTKMHFPSSGGYWLKKY